MAFSMITCQLLTPVGGAYGKKTIESRLKDLAQGPFPIPPSSLSLSYFVPVSFTLSYCNKGKEKINSKNK